MKVVETFSRLQTPPVQMHKKKGGIEGAKELTVIAKTIRELYKGVIIAKVFPLDEKDEYYFVGGLDGECLQDDRNRMLLKFGVAPTAKWTVLGQVASVPQPTLPSQEIPDFSSISFAEGTMADVLEQVLDTFNTLLTQTGMAISVRHPAIAITPLAIFRG